VERATVGKTIPHLPRRRRAHRHPPRPDQQLDRQVLVAPRSQLDQRSKREEVPRTGVYLLVGPDPDDPLRALADIGEGDNGLKRLLRRSWDEAKDIWEGTVVVSRDENLPKSYPATLPEPDKMGDHYQGVAA
jgi:hypothetical protein